MNLKKTDYLGLRYINQMVCPKGHPFQWEGIIDSRLLNPIFMKKFQEVCII
ncbi:MAG: hypothetical protein LBV42_03995 [Methanobrevibacter sp.]|jgi:hypothetical protein|nr:hypothetical protein [Methanobrevibacter sp.]